MKGELKYVSMMPGAQSALAIGITQTEELFVINLGFMLLVSIDLLLTRVRRRRVIVVF